MRVNRHNKPPGGVLIYVDDVMWSQVIEADDGAGTDDGVGWVIHYDKEWDDEKHRWVPQVSLHGEALTRKVFGRVRIACFLNNDELVEFRSAYNAGLVDGRTGSTNWSGALYTYDFALRDEYNRGYRAAQRGF